MVFLNLTEKGMVIKMIFSCEKALLQAAIGTAGRAVAAKSSIPALEGILVEATDRGLRLTGYNLETGITTLVDADISQEGSLVLSARLFGEIVRKLPDDVVSVNTNGNTVSITCGPTSFEIIGSDPREFPELPEVDDGNGLVVTQDTLKGMISRVIFAVSDNESRPIHTGALFEVSDQELTMVAVDGYRLALRREAIVSTSGAHGFSFVVPGAALNEVEKICSDCDEVVSITEGKRHITFQIGNTLLVARRLEGEFLNYRQTIPQNNSISITADTKALLTSIDRASLIINEKLKSPLRCKFEDGSLSITSKTAVGSAFDRCDITGDGKGLEIGFNNRFLMEAVRAAPADAVRMELNTPTSPCLILPQEGEKDNFLYMVLPVRLKAGE
jgi:DNA polymerase-3 subunit beta